MKWALAARQAALASDPEKALVAAGFDADAFLRGRALATMKAF